MLQWLSLFIPLPHYTILQSRALSSYSHHNKCSINASFMNEDLATLHQKVGSIFLPLNLDGLVTVPTNRAGQKWCSGISKAISWKDTASAWLSLFGMHALGNPESPLEEAQTRSFGVYMWRGTGIFLANSQQQLPDIWMNEPSNDSSSQPLSLPASDTVEQKEAIPAVPCPDSWSTESVSIIMDCPMSLNLG